MPDLSGKVQVVLMAESVPGTAETLATAGTLTSGAVMTLASDVSYTPDILQTERSAQTLSFSSRGNVSGTRMAKIAFKANLRGRVAAFSASVLPDVALPFRACGCSVTMSGGGGSEIVTVAPVDTVSTWYTVGIFNDGRHYRIAGSLGTVKLTFETGAPPTAEFEFTGVYVPPTDLGMVTNSVAENLSTGLAHGAPAPPPFLSAAVNILGLTSPTPKIKTLTVDLGNTILMRQDPNAASGFVTAVITGRKVVGSVDPEMQTISAKNYFNELISDTTGTITTGTFPSTGTQYSKQNMTITKAKYLKGGRGDRDGLAIFPIDFEAQANSDTGADEFSLVFS